MTRQLIIVDLETTGLDSTTYKILEVAAINTATDEIIHFAPHIEALDLGMADPIALQVNRYYERGAWKNRLPANATGDQYFKLAEMLKGNTFGGCNPRFDADFLTQTSHHLNPEPWHYRLADLSAYAAGALGIPADDLIGLSDICERLGVENDDPHSALGDARATAECFRKLSSLKGATK